jgi:epoxyqueuosine reductase
MTPNEDFLASEVISKLEEAGFKGRMVSVRHLGELKDEIERLHSQDLLDDAIFREYSDDFNFEIPKGLPHASSIIVVASPSPAQQVTFMVSGQPFQAIIPPTYNHDTDKKAYDCILDVLKPKGYQIVNAVVPKKLLAVRSGLARYGKNNIAYVEGMGSYHRLASFYTDAPITEDHWQKHQMLDRCNTCTTCTKKCPSGAISSDRFLLHAEKCITYYNESERPFPDWIDSSWHNCLTGCMICQDVCPENPPSVRCTVDAATFYEEETDLILKDAPEENLHCETIEKLKRVWLFSDYKLLTRNLKALLNIPG